MDLYGTSDMPVCDTNTFLSLHESCVVTPLVCMYKSVVTLSGWSDSERIVQETEL